MSKRTLFIALLLVAASALPQFEAGAAEGSASVKMGYTFVSDEGNLGVNQETYNTYEGLGISIKDLQYSFSDGVRLSADLQNVSLNNRNLRATLAKPGLFSLSVANNQYRRVYSYEGSTYARRRNTSVQASYQPTRFVRVYGGFARSSRAGTMATILSPASDTVILSSNYAHTTLNAGTQISHRYGIVRLDYRYFSFDDRTTSDIDRGADDVSASLSSSIPRCKPITVAGGYRYRKDKFDNYPGTYLRTNELWGAVRGSFRGGWVGEYRVVYDMTKHAGPLRETDNQAHTIQAGHNWTRFGGLQVGYERRVADDFVNKTTSDGFLVNAWCRPDAHWSLSARMSTRSKDVAEGTTLMGAETATRGLAHVTYNDTAWGSAGIKWQTRVRKNDDLNTKVDYQSISPEVALKTHRYGHLIVSYSYAVGKFNDMSSSTSYEFKDHLLAGTIWLPTWHNLTADLGATYYRSLRDQDIEKSYLNIGLMYGFMRDYHIEVRYGVFNYDNFLLTDQYYTGNIVEVNLIKDFSL